MVSQNAVIAAFSSTALISLAPNVLLLLFPNFASGDGQNHSPILSLGQCLAAGGLLGDVFLHVVPHAGGDHDVGLYILLGFTIFLIVDMIMRSISGSSHSHNNDHGGEDKKKSSKIDSDDDAKSSSATILLNLAADALHNVSKTITTSGT
jgi:zinc transporter 7